LCSLSEKYMKFNWTFQYIEYVFWKACISLHLIIKLQDYFTGIVTTYEIILMTISSKVAGSSDGILNVEIFRYE
jgi:hypothetical protein